MDVRTPSLPRTQSTSRLQSSGCADWSGLGTGVGSGADGSLDTFGEEVWGRGPG